VPGDETAQLFLAPTQQITPAAQKNADKMRVDFSFQAPGSPAATTVRAETRLDIVEPGSITVPFPRIVDAPGGGPRMHPWRVRTVGSICAGNYFYFRLRDHFGDPVDARNDRRYSKIKQHKGADVGIRVHIYETFAHPAYWGASGKQIVEADIATNGFQTIRNSRKNGMGIWWDRHYSTFPPTAPLWVDSANGQSVMFSANSTANRLPVGSATLDYSVRLVDAGGNVLFQPLVLATGIQFVRIKGALGDTTRGVGIGVPASVQREGTAP